MKTRLAISMILCLVSAGALLAAVPQQINYQGYLTDTSGNPLDTTVAMTFKLYTDSTAGSLLWTETRPSVTATNGLFNVRLGQITSLGDAIFNNSQIWLGITVGNNSEMTPRSRIVSVGYAYRVGTVDGSMGGTITGKVNMGSNNTNAGSYAFVSGFGNHADSSYSTVGGGKFNVASGNYSTVGGGASNTASGYTATVGGGTGNIASGSFATVSGGFCNQGIGFIAVVGGGDNNRARGNYSVVSGGGGPALDDSNSTLGAWCVVSGGRGNFAAENYSTVSGGHFNSASDTGAMVSGGESNASYANFATVGGGYGNSSGGDFATVGGGVYHWAAGNSATIGGGAINTATALSATVAGGSGNHASGDYSFAGGGTGNYATDYAATVGGGSGNRADSTYATVGGGWNNTATDHVATVAGGYSNSATGYAATVAGGYDNSATSSMTTVGGGEVNIASGWRATIPGGSHNVAAGDYSFAAGRRAKANNQGCFVWGDATDADISANNNNRWMARACGGVYFYTNAGMTTGSYLGAGSGTWNSVSDSTKKRNLRLVDTEEILDKVAQLPIKQWSYKSQDPSIEHIGPMAQDFWKLFHLGEDSLGISTVDPGGIALAAIQELQKQNAELKTENIQLQKRLENVEQQLQQLCRQGGNYIKQASFTEITQ